MKLNKYLSYFDKDTIQEFRKYKYVISCLYMIDSFNQENKQMLLNIDISKKIQSLISFYTDKIQKLKTKIVQEELKDQANNLS